MGAVVYPKTGALPGGAPNYLGSFTWATKPSATAVAGGTAYITDVGSGGGSNWFSDGVIWRPVGKCTLQSRITADTLTGAEAIFQQQVIPAGMLQLGIILRLTLNVTKSAASFGASINPRLGTAGTTSDAALLAAVIFVASASRSAAIVVDIIRVTATTVRVVTSGNISSYTSSSAVLADVTVPSVDSNALYASLSAYVTTETITNRLFSVEVL